MARILNGPSKYDLSVALFHRKPGLPANIVEFTLDNTKVVAVLILEVGQEDGSGESWNLRGSVRRESGGNPWVPIKFYYRTDKRTGHMPDIIPVQLGTAPGGA